MTLYPYTHRIDCISIEIALNKSHKAWMARPAYKTPANKFARIILLKQVARANEEDINWILKNDLKNLDILFMEPLVIWRIVYTTSLKLNRHLIMFWYLRPYFLITERIKLIKTFLLIITREISVILAWRVWPRLTKRNGPHKHQFTVSIYCQQQLESVLYRKLRP